MRLLRVFVCLLGMAAAMLPSLHGQTPDQAIKNNFDSVHRRLLDMAKDFPADKYSFRLKPEMRSFGEVLVHVTSGVVYAAKAGRGEKVKWDELNPKDFANKTAIVALMERSIADADKSMTALPAASFTKTVEPWLDVLEHSAEHYGLLVAYFRANGIVPPESRPKK
ncbi:MAG: hypothetical protein C5B51_14170 [Terriglobia bacterium]|nr:MAG: hypothetical protein C5B51_14170 [Terriglobia bacterium]